MVVRLVSKLSHSRPIALSNLLQSYLSTALLFAGVYFTLYLYDHGTFHHFHIAQTRPSVWTILTQALYFSVSVMSLTCFGDVYPELLSSRLLVSVHLLVSVSYGVVIFGLGTSRFIQQMGWANNQRAYGLHA
jgi:hypothetical protein